jgi:hypothetical protein
MITKDYGYKMLKLKINAHGSKTFIIAIKPTQ